MITGTSHAAKVIMDHVPSSFVMLQVFEPALAGERIACCTLCEDLLSPFVSRLQSKTSHFFHAADIRARECFSERSVCFQIRGKMLV